METVSVRLTTAWPSPAGLRRPAEGPISFPIAEAVRIVDASAGEVPDSVEAKAVTSFKRKKAAAEKAAAEKAEAEKAEAEKAEAEKAAADKAAADKADAEKLPANDGRA